MELASRKKKNSFCLHLRTFRRVDGGKKSLGV
jgi:hypothetical protein